jgi:hypothetical protein
MENLVKRYLRNLLRRLGGCGMARCSTRPPGTTRLHLEHLEDRRLMSTVTNPSNNLIIPHVQVETVFYGSVWTAGQNVTGYQQINGVELATEATDLNQFFYNVGLSPYMDGLSQYTGSNGAPGHGQFLGTDFAPDLSGVKPNVNNPASWTPITDQQIQTMLQTEITNKNIPAPDGDKLYVVFLPPGVGTTGDLSPTTGKPDGGGHHRFFTTNSGVNAYYAVIEHPLSGFLPKGLNLSNVTRLQQLTDVASHELVEAVTDPLGNAWYDRNPKPDPLSRDEIGDITQDQPPASGPVAMEDGYLPAGEGYMVQKYWSELAQTSIAPGGTAFQPLQNLLNLPQLGGRFYLESEQNGQHVRIDLVIGSLLQAGTNSASYQAFWGPAAESVVANVSLDGSTDTIQITVVRKDGSSVFQGFISVPENDWRMTDELEMSGTIVQPSGVFYAFAVGESTTPFIPGPGYLGPGPANGGGSFTPGSSWLPHHPVLA